MIGIMQRLNLVDNPGSSHYILGWDLTVSEGPIRLAVVGGGRGGRYNLSTFEHKIKIVAVCDVNEQTLNKWKIKQPEVQTYSSYDELLDNPDIDAILLATPLFLHAQQAIRGLRAGKHVLSEVIAAHTLEGCWELAETVEQTGLTYMLSENYCYMRPNMMVMNMIEQGLFGQITHVEGAYVHDCRMLTHFKDGSTTWRGELQRNYNGMNYPTHSLGPLAKWLNIGGEGGDEFDYLTTFTTASAAMNKYFKQYFGDDHPGAQPGYWQQGDSATTLIRTKKGVVITLRVDWVSARPHNMMHYGLQGTHGAYLSERHDKESPLVWIEDKSTGISERMQGNPYAEWDSLWKYEEEYEHPLWKKSKETAANYGHGGGDFFTIQEFADAILQKRKPFIDVYDAIAWSSVFPLSVLSVSEGGKPVAFPDFRRT